MARRSKSTTADRSINGLVGFSATDLAKSMGKVTRVVMKRGAAVITRHDQPVMVVLSIDRYRQLEKTAAPDLDALTLEFDTMYARMQASGVAEKSIAALNLRLGKRHRAGTRRRRSARSGGD